MHNVACNLNDIKHNEPWSWRHLENEFQFKIINLITTIKFCLWYMTMLLYPELFFSFRKFKKKPCFFCCNRSMSILFICFSILIRNNSSFVIHHFINLLFSGIEFYNGEVTLPIWELGSPVPVGIKDAVNIISNLP